MPTTPTQNRSKDKNKGKYFCCVCKHEVSLNNSDKSKVPVLHINHIEFRSALTGVWQDGEFLICLTCCESIYLKFKKAVDTKTAMEPHLFGPDGGLIIVKH